MNKLLLGGAAATLLIGIAPAIAQTAPPAGVAQGTVQASPQVNKQVRVKVMSDRTMTRDQVVTHVRDIFARLDTNKDGYLTRPEIEAMHGKMMAMHGDVTKKLGEHGVFVGDRGATFDRLDTNHDGTITRQEFTTAQPQIRQERVIVMRDGVPGTPGTPGAPGMRMHTRGMGMGGFGGRMFEMADSNRDGRVSLAEAQAAALAHFDKADVNRDGRITPDERQQLRVLRREHRQG
jgi:hypothetical protein